jgi:type III secretory pathway component EscR
MRHLLGYVLYLAAIAITALVVAAKYFNFGYPPVTPLLMSDPTRSLLVALGLSFVARWL